MAEPVQATEKDVSEAISAGSKLYLDRLPELEAAVGQLDADLGGLYGIAVEYSTILENRAAEAKIDPKPLLTGDFDDELVQMGRFLLSQTQRALLAVEKFAIENPRLINAAEFNLAREIWPLRHVPVQLALCLENAREKDLTEESGHLALLSQFGKEDARLNTTTIRKLGIIPVDVETYRLVSRGLDAADNRPVYAELLNNLLKSVQTR